MRKASQSASFAIPATNPWSRKLFSNRRVNSKCFLYLAPLLWAFACAQPDIARNGDLAQIAANLKLLEAAKEEWAYANKKTGSEKVSIADLQPIKAVTPVIGEQYIVTNVGSYVQAVLPRGTIVAGKTGPFTITSF